MIVDASSHMAALVNRNNTGPFTERSMSARRRLSVFETGVSGVSMISFQKESQLGLALEQVRVLVLAQVQGSVQQEFPA